MKDSGRIKSGPTWIQFKRPKNYAPLTQDIDIDVAIVGGGLVGILTAYALAKTGKKVAVFEMHHIGSGATEYTTAFLTQIIDTRIKDLISMYGTEKVRKIWDSHSAAIDLIEKIVVEEKIDCEFMRCSDYIYAASQRQKEGLLNEFKVMQNFGLKIKMLPSTYFAFDNYGAIEIENQAKFHPLKFLITLADIIAHRGVHIFENTKITAVNEADKLILETANGPIVTSEKVTIATYDPLGNPKETFAKKGMYDSYVLEAQIPRGLIPEGIYEDIHNPYHYFRIDEQGDYDRIIIGGEDHRSELPVSREKNFKALEEYLRKILRANYRIVRKWSGPILEPSDGLALIGEYKKNHFIAAAFSGNGMTYSGISALILRDLILNIPNKWVSIYNPLRKPTARQLSIKFRDYAEEWMGGAVKNTIRF